MGWFRDLGRDKPWAQGCVIGAAGAALAASGCFGFIVTANVSGPEALGMFLGGAFVLGVLTVPVGFVWWLVGLVRGSRRVKVAPVPAPPPAGDAGPGTPPP